MVTEDSVAVSGQEPKTENGAAAPKPVELRPQAPRRPTLNLPSKRIAFGKQLDILRAFDAASGLNTTPVTLADVGRIVKIQPDTIAMASPYFQDVGFIQKTESGRFVPTQAAHEYALAYEWGPATAGVKLAPPLRHHWAFQAIEPQLKFSRGLDENELLNLLASAANASPEYKAQLRLCLSYLEVAGLLVREGSMLRLGSAVDTPSAAGPRPTEGDSATEDPPVPQSRQANPASVATSFTQQPEGLVQFAVSVRVDMAELRGWRPDRIAAFFAGIAQVLAAKGDVEAGSADGQRGSSAGWQ